MRSNTPPLIHRCPMIPEPQCVLILAASLGITGSSKRQSVGNEA